MSTLTNCLKGLAAVAVIAASPVFIIFAVPFGCGVASDVANAAGAPAALACTTAICIAASAWARYRPREPRHAPPKARPVKSLR
jgi:hypothetical protein